MAAIFVVMETYERKNLLLYWTSGYTETRLAEIKKRTRAAITALIEKGIIYYSAGGARGFDTNAAETVLELKEDYHQIKLILVLPY